MNANSPNRKLADKSWMMISRWLVLLCMLLVFTLTAAWPANHSPVKAAEPDLTLLNTAYASAVPNKLMMTKVGMPLTLTAAAFNPDSNTRSWFYGFNSSYIYPNGESGYCGIAAVYLPDRALLTSFKGYVFDNNVTGSVDLYLYAKPFASMVSSTTLAHAATTSNTTEMQLITDTTFDPRYVDNTAYTYHVGVCLSSTDTPTRFYSAQVGYELQTFLPMISR